MQPTRITAFACNVARADDEHGMDLGQFGLLNLAMILSGQKSPSDPVPSGCEAPERSSWHN